MINKQRILIGSGIFILFIFAAFQLSKRSDIPVLTLSERGLKRVQELVPAHARFAKNSLTIGQGDYAHALMEAKELKRSLQERTEERSSLLYHFNLLRIAFLEMQLGNPQEELAGWTELLQAGEQDPREWALLLSCFQKEDLSLLDFIHARQKVLSNLSLSHS